MNVLNKGLRRRILEKGCEMNNGHFGSALSCLDCIKYLYDNVLRKDLDIFIMSKGHGEMALFSVLESIGKKPDWTIHLDLDEKNGVYATTGSLGHGLAIGLGRAFAKKLKGEDGKVYVLVGDGEMEEGSIWEALALAKRLEAYNLKVLVDYNKYQAIGSVKEIGGIDNKSLAEKLNAFGCSVVETDGHTLDGLSKLKQGSGGLDAFILSTIKGKGVRCLEENHAHVYYWKNHQEEYSSALEELK